MFHDDAPFIMPYHPALIGVWVPYTGARYKDIHDLILKDGRVLPNYRPNACAWHKSMLPDGVPHDDNHPHRVTDEDVLYIKLTSDEHLGEYDYTGTARIDHNCHLFSGCIPSAIMFRMNEFSVVKSVTFDGYVAIDNRRSLQIVKNDEGIYACENEDAEIPSTVKSIVDLLNMNARYKWPYANNTSIA